MVLVLLYLESEGRQQLPIKVSFGIGQFCLERTTIYA